jgi:hypothetical protein
MLDSVSDLNKMCWGQSAQVASSVGKVNTSPAELGLQLLWETLWQ